MPFVSSKIFKAVFAAAAVAAVAFVTLSHVGFDEVFGSSARDSPAYYYDSETSTPSFREPPPMMIAAGNKKIVLREDAGKDAGDDDDEEVGIVTEGVEVMTELPKSVHIPESNSSSSTDGELCPLVPPTLVGKVKVIKEPLPWDTIRKLNPDVAIGGRHRPSDCVSRHRVAVIIPFRDREQHLKIFLRHLHPILQRQQLEYGIFVINQFGDSPFNRASLFNVGFLESLTVGQFDCFVFHDVDLLPEDDRISYGCPEDQSKPRHLSVAIDKFGYKLPYATIFGGAVALTREQLTSLNGWSNQFWGWGGEDDDMGNRINARKMKVTRFPKKIARYTMLKHKNQTASPARFKLIKQGKVNFERDGLNNIQYQIMNTSTEALYTNITVKLYKVKPLRKTKQKTTVNWISPHED